MSNNDQIKSFFFNGQGMMIKTKFFSIYAYPLGIIFTSYTDHNENDCSKRISYLRHTWPDVLNMSRH